MFRITTSILWISILSAVSCNSINGLDLALELYNENIKNKNPFIAMEIRREG